MALAGLKLKEILLPLPPEGQNERHAPPCPVLSLISQGTVFLQFFFFFGLKQSLKKVPYVMCAMSFYA